MTTSAEPSPVRAFAALALLSFQRHWRVRQLGWVALGLLGIVVAWVAVVSPRAWDMSEARLRRGHYPLKVEADRLALPNRLNALGDTKRLSTLRDHEWPAPLNPTNEGLRTLFLSVPAALERSAELKRDWGFVTFSRWVVHSVFFGFVLPLFVLSYATSAFGTDRETRSLVWLMTRPLPRGAIYLAKFVGTLPWCLAFGLGGFAAVCLAGGPFGREALARYWPAAALATVAFEALFHLVGAVFRRPSVVGLVYVFFFEVVIAVLPGSLKLLSLTYYARSLMYNEAEAAGYSVALLPMLSGQSATTPSAVGVLLAAPVLVTLFGMWLFGRLDYRDDVRGS